MQITGTTGAISLDVDKGIRLAEDQWIGLGSTLERVQFDGSLNRIDIEAADVTVDDGKWIGIDGSSPRIRYTDGAPGILDVEAANVRVDDNTWFGLGSTIERFEFQGGDGEVNLMGAELGIGTLAPSEALDVNGQIRMRTGGASGYIPVSSANGTMTWTDPATLGFDVTTASNGLTEVVNDIQLGGSLNQHTTIAQTSFTLDFTSTAVDGFSVDGTTFSVDAANDKVGIGTTTPDAKLNVGDPNGPSIYLTREDNTTAANDVLGSLLFDSTDDSGPSTNDASAGIRAYASVDHGNSNKGAHLAFFTKDNVPAATAATERMRIQANGYVGIGTQSPTSLFEVEGAVEYPIVLSRTGNVGDVGIEFHDNDVNTQTGFLAFDYRDANSISNGASFHFKSSEATKAVIIDGAGGFYANTQLALRSNGNSYLTGGNLGVGTAGPTQLLDVDGSIRMRAGTTTAGWIPISSGDGTMVWTNPAAYTGDITAVTAGTGLTGGGTSGALTVNAVGDNGLTTNADDIDLGGALNQATTITQGSNKMTFNLNGTGDFDIQDNGTSAFFVGDDGNVGVGTATPDVKLDIQTPGYGLPATTGSTQTYAGLRISPPSTSGNVVLDMGTNGATGAWLQTTLRTTLANTYPLLLNPNGGSVGVGTTGPTQALDVDGSIRMRGGTTTAGWIPVSSGDGTMVWTNPAAYTGDITGVTAGTGLTGGGTSGALTVNAVGDNGLTTNADDIDLGGALNQATTITQGANKMTFNLNGTGDFDIQDNGTSAFFVRDDGNVGIGTTTPVGKLHVVGNTAGDGGWDDDGILVQNTGAAGEAAVSFNNSVTGVNYWQTGLNQSEHYDISYGTSFTNGNSKIRIESTGNIGIGTVTPSQMLDVSGDINTTTGYRISNTATAGQYLRGNGTRFVSSAILVGDLPTITTAGGWTDDGTVVRLTTAADNVGIGTASPTSALEIYGDQSNLEISNTGETDAGIIFNDAQATTSQTFQIMFNSSDEDLHFRSDQVTDVMTLENDGDVGIGTANPVQKLDVQGNIMHTGGMMSRGANYSSTWMNFNEDVYGNSLILGGGGLTVVGAGESAANASAGIGVPGSEVLYLTSDGGIEFKTSMQGGWASRVNAMTIETAGDVGIGITNPDDKLDVGGNAQVSGYLKVGNPTVTATTRYGSRTFFLTTAFSEEDGYQNSASLGTLTIPSGASSLAVTKVVYSFNGYHDDGNEEHRAMVRLGTTDFGSISEVAGNGYVPVDWTNTSNHSTNFTSAQTVYFRIWDEDCWNCGSDKFHVLNAVVTVYYSYSVAAQTGDIVAQGTVFSSSLHSTNQIGDVAEYFNVNPVGSVHPSVGMIVSFSQGSDATFQPAASAYDQLLAGVVSENPSVLLNNPSEGLPVALTGRVKIRLKPNGVLIKSGDFITSSDIPGLGMKAEQPGPVIGFAITNQVPGEDLVEVLLQPGRFYSPTTAIQSSQGIPETSKNEVKLPRRWATVIEDK